MNTMIVIRMAFKNIWRNKRRTLSTLFTISIGSAALMIFLGFNNGIMNQYRENTIRAKYGNGQINTQGYRENIYERPYEHYIDNYQQLKEYLSSLPFVTHIFPRISFYALLNRNNINVSGMGEGVDGREESNFFTMLSFMDGKLFTNEKDGIVLGRGLAHALNVKVGDKVTVLVNNIYGSLNGADLTVTGIFWTGIKDFDDRFFRMQLARAQELLETSRIESVAFGLDKVDSFKNLEGKIKKKFPGLEITSFEVLDEVFYKHAVDWLASQFGLIKTIILFIVFLGVFNSVSSSILERSTEIGTLRANGEYPSEIATLILLEHFFLGLMGVVIGILLAVILAQSILRNGIPMPPSPGITKSFSIFLEMKIQHIPQIVIGGVVVTLLACVAPIIKLTKTPITELLRNAGY